MATKDDELTVSPSESVFVHGEVDLRAYISKSDDSECGYIPINILDVPSANQLDSSFNSLNLNFTNGVELSHSEQPQSHGDTYEKSSTDQTTDNPISDPRTEMPASDSRPEMSTSDPGTEMPGSNSRTEMSGSDSRSEMPDSDSRSEIPGSDSRPEMPASDPRTEMSNSDPRTEMSTSDPRTEMPGSDSRPEMPASDPRTEMSTSDPRTEMSTSDPRTEMPGSDSRPEHATSDPRNESGTGECQSNMLIRAKKRNINGQSIDQELSDMSIVRFIKSSRPGRGATATMVSKTNDIHYKSSIKSISSKTVVYKCFDCSALTYCEFPASSISFYYDKNDRKRPIISPDFDFDFSGGKISITSSKRHSCTGRKEESTSFLYDEMMKTAKLIINELQNPANHTANDIVAQALKALYAAHGRETIKKTMNADPESQKHSRNFEDKISRLLEKRRTQINEEPNDDEDFTIYESSIYQFDKFFYDETSLKLFYDPMALKFMCDNSIELLIDATFPSQLTKNRDWYQLLKGSGLARMKLKL